MHTEIYDPNNPAVTIAHERTAVAPDGRPFAEFRRPNPPAPGGSWPGERDNFPTTFTGYAPELTRENLDTPDKRNAAIRQFMESGFCPLAAGSSAAVKLMDLAIREIQGEELTAEEFRSLDAGRQRIARFNKSADDKLKEFERAERLKKLESAHKLAADELAVHKDALSKAEALIESAPDALKTKIQEHPGQIGEAIAHIGRVASARELVKFLKRYVLPDAEKDLADAANALTASQQATG